MIDNDYWNNWRLKSMTKEIHLKRDYLLLLLLFFATY